MSEPSDLPVEPPADPEAEIPIEEEAGPIRWSELMPHFARGVVIRVAPELDLIEVARAFRDDATHEVSAWLASGQVARASDEDARRWTEADPVFTAIVAAPWVLAQERTTAH
ncbi:MULTISPECIES: DUF2288 domain-containing protein [unclassified Thioalkalivibrio]|uniref:DUF2288 domain-containing protein n=1 Tax=unclassified Thioalkalivibrio TaxID=2621013 RepID=UPI00037D84B6|nr:MULTISPECIES: DUF2288 domain-containing protein [unclassified Thioalkalivibrio]